MLRLGRRLLVFVAVVGALAMLLGGLGRERARRRELAEPRVGSMPLSRWLLDNPYSIPDEAANGTLAHEGKGTVPTLVRLAEQGLSPLELGFFQFWQTHLPPPLRKATARWITADPSRSAKMMLPLGSLGPEASNAVPTLLRLARVDFMGTGYHARIALLKIAPQDPEVRAVELAWLNSDSLAASHYYCETHCVYPEALPILVRKIIADPGGTENELLALAQYGAAASNALPTLLTLSKTGNANALSVVLAMGPSAAPAAEELAAQPGGAEAMDVKILDGLRRIGPGAAVTLPQIEPYLTVTNPVTRLLAEAAVASLRGEPTAVLPSFQDALKKHQSYGPVYEVSFPPLDDNCAYAVGSHGLSCWLAGEMGPAAASILPSLEACLVDEGEFVKVLAAWGHWRIAHRVDPVLPVLRAALRVPDPRVREVAIRALVEIGPPAAASEPELRAIMKSDLVTRRLVNMALTEIHRDGH